MPISQQRIQAVDQLVGEARKIVEQHGVSRRMLEEMKAPVLQLAACHELFPTGHFPVKDGHGNVYRLHEDADGSFALYASVGKAGRSQPPHNHTTWAVIAGVRGEEHNVFFERTDDRCSDHEGQLKQVGEKAVAPGDAVGVLPDDFHTIEVRSEEPALHLHLYGRSLELLPERIRFQGPQGGEYRVFPANPDIRNPVVGAKELADWLSGDQELALIDVREEAVFAQSHILAAVPVPLSRLEVRFAKRVPRRGAPVVLCDDGDGIAEAAAAKLMRFGYRDVSVLEGGVSGWVEAGFDAFSGVHVPSKAFGEFVEQDRGTPHIKADELKRLMDTNADLVVLDSRPLQEYRNMSIPGGINCPGPELVYRIQELVPSRDTLIVVNCAGRTRSIVGAQTLIDAGIPNRVVALENGTMGWHLAGQELEHGQQRRAPAPSQRSLAWANEAAGQLATRFGITLIDAGELDRMQSQANRHSVFVLDVRTPEEYEAGHVAGARSAPGVQLIQATDNYVGTCNARLILIDNDGIRATVAAAWLMQMGWRNVFVCAQALAGQALETGPEPTRVLGLANARAAGIDPIELNRLLARSEAVVWDLANSLQYRQGHIPGAAFAMRHNLPGSLKGVASDKTPVLTSADGLLARVAASELMRHGDRSVRYLEGGTRAWRGQDYALDAHNHHWMDEPNDVWYRPYDREAGVEKAMQSYLGWEVDLIDKAKRDCAVRFRSKADDWPGQRRA